jgi:hypothetical protein
MENKIDISLEKLYFDLKRLNWGEEEVQAILGAINKDPEINPIDVYGK